MKLKVIDRIKHWHSGTESIEEKIEEPPYTVFGHTSISPRFSLIMKYKGLKEIMDLMRNGDSLRITMHAGNEATEYSIVREAVPVEGNTGRGE